MSCLTPGPALVMTRMVPGIPPRRGEPMPAPALPLTMSCWLSVSHQIVALRASNSSLVRYAWARSQILGGSVTWASQSKVAKSLVIGANCCTGMLYLLSIEPLRELHRVSSCDAGRAGHIQRQRKGDAQALSHFTGAWRTPQTDDSRRVSGAGQVQ